MKVKDSVVAVSRSVMANMKESDKAGLLYTYGVTPTFFRNSILKEQTERPSNRRKST